MHFIRWQIFECPLLAHPHTLRIALAELTFIGNTHIVSKRHGPGRAGGDAHGASHTEAAVKDYPVRVGFAPDSVFGTHRHAGRVLAVLAGRRNVHRTFAVTMDRPPGEDTYSLSGDAAHTLMPLCASGLAVPASITLQGVDLKYI